ncbi:hypothetical protein ACFX2I_035977 [Malus domestica]
MIMAGKNTVGEGEIAEMVVVVMVRIVVEGKNVTGVNNINVVEIVEESGVDTIFWVLVLLPGIPFLRRQFKFVLLETRLNLQVRNMVWVLLELLFIQKMHNHSRMEKGTWLIWTKDRNMRLAKACV